MFAFVVSLPELEQGSSLTLGFVVPFWLSPPVVIDDLRMHQ